MGRQGRRRYSDLTDSEQDEFLSGARRISLQRACGPLAEAQDRACFYCAGHLSPRSAIDHFRPWSRYPGNTVDNLAAAHQACNSAKSASGPAGTALAQIASETGWPRRPGRVLATAGPCGCHPDGAYGETEPPATATADETRCREHGWQPG